MGCVWRAHIITARRLKLYSHQRNIRYKNVLLNRRAVIIFCSPHTAHNYLYIDQSLYYLTKLLFNGFL